MDIMRELTGAKAILYSKPPAPLAFLGTSGLMPRLVTLAFCGVAAAIRLVPFFIYGLIFIRVSGPER